MPNLRSVSYKIENNIICDFYGNDKSQYCYIPLLKNASRWGISFFKQNFNFDLTENIENKKFIIFVRDPKERWLSGVAQWFTNNVANQNNLVLDETHLKLIFSSGSLDHHSSSQFTVLEALIHTQYRNLIFFRVDNSNFYSNFQKFIQFNMNVDIDIIPSKLNVTSENLFQLNIRNQIKDALNNNKLFQDQLDEFLLKDYEKINKHIKFYEDRYGTR